MLEALLAHWPLKLLALLIAFGIWITVTGESSVIQDFRPPLTIAIPADRALAADSPTVVTVRLRGPESMLRRLDAIEGSVSLRFPYFVTKRAPVSGVESLMDYDVCLSAEARPGDIILTVGAGSVWKIGEALGELLRNPEGEASLTSAHPTA